MENIDRIIRNLCSNASFDGGTVSVDEVDLFLDQRSDLYFCYGRAFRVVFKPITDKTYKIAREWL